VGGWVGRRGLELAPLVGRYCTTLVPWFVYVPPPPPPHPSAWCTCKAHHRGPVLRHGGSRDCRGWGVVEGVRRIVLAGAAANTSNPHVFGAGGCKVAQRRAHPIRMWSSSGRGTSLRSRNTKLEMAGHDPARPAVK
jgi:hypothetical protein